MNKVILCGRLTADPQIRQAGQAGTTTIATYTLAVDRRFKRDGEPSADFIRCIAFNKAAEFVDKYAHKGTKLIVTGRIQTGLYQKDGQTIYTTDVIVDEQEFAESKSSAGGSGSAQQKKSTHGEMPEWLDIPEDVPELDGVPFN